ncbi:MAG: thermonuclease family protein [Mycobacteriales bacterium]
MKIAQAAALALACFVVVGCEADKPATAPTTQESSAALQVLDVEPTASAPAVDAQPSAWPAAAAVVWLAAASGGDGDSWKDTTGRAYRLGLVNAPETNECYGGVATRKRRQLTANGFRARVYTRDSYGRAVSVVTLRDGTNLNVYLARHGYANDKYLAEFRHENPSLAAQLDGAFAAAKREKAGLWSACAPKPAAAPPLVQKPTSSCHPDYLTCIPIKGDGSGNGAANDLDCPDIGKQVQLRQVGVDPYRLDADGDGTGCDSY